MAVCKGRQSPYSSSSALRPGAWTLPGPPPPAASCSLTAWRPAPSLQPQKSPGAALPPDQVPAPQPRLGALPTFWPYLTAPSSLCSSSSQIDFLEQIRVSMSLYILFPLKPLTSPAKVFLIL